MADPDHALTPSPDAAAATKPAAAKGVAEPKSTGVLWRCGLAILTGLCMAFGVPDHDMWWLGFVGWVPLMAAIDGQRLRAAYLYGLLAGVVAVFVGFFWMTELLTRFAGFPLYAAAGIHLLFALAQGQVWALSSLIMVAVERRSGVRMTWLAAPSWVVLEWLWPAIFPTYMSLMWCWQPMWIQLAEIGGPQAVSFVMLAINAAIWALVRGQIRKESFDYRPAVALAAYLVLVPAYGALRIRQIDAIAAKQEHVKFAVVQGNFGILTFADPDAKPVFLGEMQRVTAELEAQGAQIALWGETAYPYSAFRRESTSDLRKDHPKRVRVGFTIPIIFGAITSDRKHDNPFPWNSALVLDRDGNLTGRYDKVYPLIFGEWVPFVDPKWYLATVPGASYINIGEGPRALEVEGVRVGPLICYEDILPRYARMVAAEKVSVFVNMTNDSWFGKTREPSEHLGLAVFRSIEHRKPLLRAVVAGRSAYVDPAGRVVTRTEVTDSDREPYKGGEGFIADVPIMDPNAISLYARIGDLFSALCLGALAIVHLFRRRPEEMTTASASPAPAEQGAGA